MTRSHYFRGITLVVLLVMMSACRSSAPSPTAGTGAREVVQKYFAALKVQDWDAAYSCLDASTPTRFSRADFQHRAQSYCMHFNLPARNLVIRSCDEQGEKAIAQIILADANISTKHRVREALVLHATPKGWAIVLPANFGNR